MNDQNDAAISESKMPMIAYLLYIIGAIVPLLTLIGLILAYLNRGDAPDWHKTHYTYLIHTFWKGLLFSVIALVLMFVGIGFILMIAVLVWFLVRVIKGLLDYNKGQPIGNPTTWMI